MKMATKLSLPRLRYLWAERDDTIQIYEDLRGPSAMREMKRKNGRKR